MAGWDDRVAVHEGDCLAVMRTLADCSIDAVVTDPPYELGFMGEGWDRTGIANSVPLWSEVLRVLKPGGHLASFGGTRTYHRLACAIEDAGFEVRDQLAWVYGSGFPKSRNIGDGWGTALKPAWEPICLARKPLSEQTVAANVLRWGTGAINVDATRIAAPDGVPKFNQKGQSSVTCYGDGLHGSARTGEMDTATGRWPANLCHDGSPEVLELFPETKSGNLRGETVNADNKIYGNAGSTLHRKLMVRDGDAGSAARFFYCAKAAANDRLGSKHPTVKPVALMQWLARLITPPGGTILDPFAGTGTTGDAAWRDGFSAILIEREAEYRADIVRRMDHALKSQRERKQTVARVRTDPLGGLFAEASSLAEACA